MELFLIPLLLIGGTLMVYLGARDSRQTAWATYGPHLVARSGKRLSLEAEATVSASPVEPALDTYAAVPYSEPQAVTNVGLQANERSFTFESLLPLSPAGANLDQVSLSELAAPEFQTSDALVGELLNELAVMREELSELREQMAQLCWSLQPDTR